MSTSTIPQVQIVPTTAVDWMAPLRFAQFDASLGTLTYVQTTVTSDLSSTLDVSSLAPSAEPFSLGVAGTTSLALPGAGSIATAAPLVSNAITLAANGRIAGTLDVSDIAQSSFDDSATASGNVAAAGAIGAAVTGTGTVLFTASSSAGVTETSGGNVLSRVTTRSDATASVGYAYASPSGGGGGVGSSGLTLLLGTANLPVAIAGDATTTQTFRIADAATGWADVLHAQRFDPSLGTLDAINFTVVGDSDSDLAVENLGGAEADFSLQEQVNVSLTAPGEVSAVAAGPSLSASPTLAAWDGTLDFSGSSGMEIGRIAGQGNGSASLTSSADLSAYEGPGTVDLTVSSSSPAVLNGPGNFAAALRTNAGATVQVAYVYRPAKGAAPAPTGPVIRGVEAGLTVADTASIDPLAGGTITDAAAAPVLTAVVSLSDVGGGLLSNSSRAGTIDLAHGQFTVSGSASTVTDALRALQFAPAQVARGQTRATGFSLVITDGAGGMTSASTTVTTTSGLLLDTATLAHTLLQVPSPAPAPSSPSEPSPASAGPGDANPPGSMTVVTAGGLSPSAPTFLPAPAAGASPSPVPVSVELVGGAGSDQFALDNSAVFGSLWSTKEGWHAGTPPQSETTPSGAFPSEPVLPLPTANPSDGHSYVL